MKTILKKKVLNKDVDIIFFYLVVGLNKTDYDLVYIWCGMTEIVEAMRN